MHHKIIEAVLSLTLITLCLGTEAGPLRDVAHLPKIISNVYVPLLDNTRAQGSSMTSVHSPPGLSAPASLPSNHALHHCSDQTTVAIIAAKVSSFPAHGAVYEPDNGGAQTTDEDSEFYRFGRSLLQHIDPEDEPYTSQIWFKHPREYFTPQLDDNALFRDRREFYRFGRSQTPFEEKRFLRFGRSLHSDGEDSQVHGHVPSMKPLYRKRRESESGSQTVQLLHHSKRSAQSNDPAENDNNNESNQKYQKREASAPNTKIDDQISNDNALSEDQEAGKRFMRFGKRFMRFGRGNEDSGDYDKRFMRFGRDQEDDSDYEKRFMRFGKRFDSEPDFDKRFMRFGKRFMRFGRGYEDAEHNEKRFMRFGKSVDYNEDPEKRFMRFGKSEDYNEDPEKRFMRFGKSVDYNEDPEKRFMRFGKRFMRFGKRFMRFGRQGEKSGNELLNVYNDSDNSVEGGHTENSSS